MAMISVYMDETGHLDDPNQQVVGMAGLINSVDNWELLHAKWKEALWKAKVPHFKDNPEPFFHTTEFKASRKTFEEWSGQRIKQNKLYDKLLRIIESTYAVPFGSIITIDAWKELTSQQQARFLDDPYYFCAVECAFSILRLTVNRPPEETVDIYFSEKQKVKGRVGKIFNSIRSFKEFRDRISDPIFRDMKKFPALQAADLVAWEMNAECRRYLFNPENEQSEGWKRLVKQRDRYVTAPRKHEVLQFHPADYVQFLAKDVEAGIARLKRSITTSDT